MGKIILKTIQFFLGPILNLRKRDRSNSQKEINLVDSETALAEIGENGREELDNFCKFINAPFPLQVRYAPSIITRSEAQLFGISIPRFAYRFCLSGQSGFINCRRLRTLIENNAHAECGERDSTIEETAKHPAISKEIPPEPLNDILKRTHQICIADCLLATPNALMPETKYEILKTDLTAAYGECLAVGGEGSFKATPYTRSVELGGLCAQSVCYVSTVLLHEHAKGIYGLAEITAFAHPDHLEELCVSGLSLDDMSRYFERINLNAIQQAPIPDFNDENRYERQRQREFSHALKAYLYSGMPIILPVDMGRMAGYGLEKEIDGAMSKSIYERNCYSIQTEHFDDTKTHEHAIILVGYCRNPGSPDTEFIFHDSAVMPFMTAVRSQLERVGHYKDKAMSEREDRLILPVTPNRVKTPLLWGRETKTKSFHRGLLQLACDLHERRSKDPTKYEYPLTNPTEGGNFVLSECKHVMDIKWLSLLSEKYQPLFATISKTFPTELTSKCNWQPEHWVWLEIFDNAIWVWDAEREMPSASNINLASERVENYLRAIIHVAVGDHIQIKWF